MLAETAAAPEVVETGVEAVRAAARAEATPINTRGVDGLMGGPLWPTLSISLSRGGILWALVHFQYNGT